MQNLSVSDLLSLETGFHTAREDESDDQEASNQEATVGTGDATSRQRVNERELGPSPPAMGHNETCASDGTASEGRSPWHDRSRSGKQSKLLRQQQVPASKPIDGGSRRPSRAGIEPTFDDGSTVAVNNEPSSSNVTPALAGCSMSVAGSDGESAKETCRNLAFDEHQIDALAGLDMHEYHHHHRPAAPIQIKIDSTCLVGCGELTDEQRRRSICEQEPFNNQLKTSLGTSGKPKSRLDATKLFLEEINNILAVPVAPPPTRAASETELESEPKVTIRARQVSGSDKIEPISRSNSLLQMNKPLVGPNAYAMSSTSQILLGVQHNDTGSLSDNSYKLTKYCSSRKYPYEKKQFEERFKEWKKSNKIITNIHENPLSMHMDCLDRLSELESSLSKTSDQLIHQRVQEAQEDAVASQQQQHQQAPGQQQQQQQLNQYANHLTHLYKRNQEIMDSNSEFRTLLYNIICCLLVQDEQVLATPSVGKMLEVIRQHLDSASKVYTSTSSLLISQSTPNSGQEPSSEVKLDAQQAGKLDGSSDGWSCASSTASNLVNLTNVKTTTTTTGVNQDERAITPMDDLRVPEHISGRSKKPVDFRRISSVSYNDQQLINDLCDGYNPARLTGQRSGSLSASSGLVGQAEQQQRQQRDSWSPSPWAYRELSERPHCSSNNNMGSGTSQTQYTSQSSLEQMLNCVGGQGASQLAAINTTTTATDSNHSDLMNDSGNGTMYEFQIASDFGVGLRRSSQQSSSAPIMQRAASICSESLIGGLTKLDQANSGNKYETTLKHNCARRRLSDFKPQQQPSYMSTDDYLSTTNNNNNNNNNNNRTSFYDDENSSSLQRFEHGSVSGENPASTGNGPEQPVDIAARRSELEWTLNKLINIELKHTWLTSQDTLRRAIRKIGVPNEIRGKVWLILIDQMIGVQYNLGKILEQARQTIENEDVNNVVLDDETQSILKQIELDVNRTMPGHRLFDDGAEGGVKLRLILVAYSIHVNRAIAYCQGFNFIVALLLSVFEGDEEKALSGFICIVDHIFPSKYYFDHYLTGARADQFLLADFICDQLIKNPTLAERKMVEGVTSSITLNWFISLFHGAVPTLTRLTILDHFMLEGVKALFRFTMAILYLAFQVTPPSSCEIFQTIRNTAKDMYDIKLLLSIVGQIKLPKDSYFAIRRSFYMVQSSFNSDQFYMQSLSSEASRSMSSSKPLSVQQPPDTKPPALSLISPASILNSGGSAFTIKNSISTDNTLRQQQQSKPRTRTSANRSKVCIQSLGKLGRSHLRVIDTNSSSNERSLMSPLRNCLIIGISNCGKHLVLARQSSKRNYRTFREQDLNFHVHELHTEIFDGFYLEEQNLAIILTHQGEIFKVDTSTCCQGSSQTDDFTETLMLRESNSLAEHDKVKLRLCTLDRLTNLLWIYVECEDSNSQQPSDIVEAQTAMDHNIRRFRSNNPFLAELSECSDDHLASKANQRAVASPRVTYSRKIIIVDIVTFDLFSAFAVYPNFGEITSLRASLVAYCQLLNPASNQFSTRIVQIGPTGRYEQLLSFSDVVDYMISVPESYKQKYIKQFTAKLERDRQNEESRTTNHRYSTLKRLLTHSMSFHQQQPQHQHQQADSTSETEPCDTNPLGSGTLTRYYRSLMRSYSTATELKMDSELAGSSHLREEKDSNLRCGIPRGLNDPAPTGVGLPKLIQDAALRSIVASSFGDFSELSETNYIPVNMAFIFRNGKIALFEFTESYAIHTRESQLDRYDYSKVIDVTKNGEDFIVTILTVFDKLIKVVI